jgi:hypothetical protein
VRTHYVTIEPFASHPTLLGMVASLFQHQRGSQGEKDGELKMALFFKLDLLSAPPSPWH